MAHRIPECFRRLPRQSAAGLICNRHGQHDRDLKAKLFEKILHRIDGGLGVERVKDRLNQDGINAALDQAARRIAIGFGKTIKVGIAFARIINIGRDRGGPVGRPDGTGNKARLVCARRRISTIARQLCPLNIQLISEIFHRVIALGNGRCGECIGLNDICTRLKIGAVHVLDDLRARQNENVIIAPDVLGPISEPRTAIARLVQLIALDERPRCPVQHQNALAKRLF